MYLSPKGKIPIAPQLETQSAALHHYYIFLFQACTACLEKDDIRSYKFLE
jgi:hypothetical protein